MNDQFDVIIVGAGPGGSSAAIRCAQAGLQVVIIERESFPRDRPGETLHPQIVPLLAELDVAEAFTAANFGRFPGVWMQTSGEPRFESFAEDDDGPWNGFQACRDVFDALLLDKARALGVEVRQPCAALSLLLRAGSVTGIQTARGPIHAPYTIDAAGGNHWLARRQRIRLQYSSSRLIARYGYEHACVKPDGDLPLFSIGPGGWSWLSQIRQDRYHWITIPLRQRNSVSPMVPKEYFGRPANACARGTDVSWRIVSAPAGPGYFMVGDAAWVLDPASSHGVIKAIRGGIRAADFIAAGIADPLSAELRAGQFSDWLAGWYRSDVVKLQTLYHRYGMTETFDRRPRARSASPFLARQAFASAAVDRNAIRGN